MEKPRAVLFDAYGTLFDVYSVGLLAEQLFRGQGARLATGPSGSTSTIGPSSRSTSPDPG